MANMGASRLILIDPKCEHLSQKAKMGAAGAQPLLENATVYNNFDLFYKSEGQGVRLAFTAREGQRRKVDELSLTLKSLGTVSPIYFIFGPEDNGLTNEDMAFVNAAVSLPSFGEFKSFNLSQAVLLACFIARDFYQPQIQPPTLEPLDFPDEELKSWIKAIGFDVRARRASAYRVLRRLFLQNAPRVEEMHVLKSVLQQTLRKLDL